MRIVCPNCGEEPQKGQRHICSSRVVDVPSPEKPTATARAARRPAVQVATPNVVCASLASLVSKNPGLWKSNRSLARCGGEDREKVQKRNVSRVEW